MKKASDRQLAETRTIGKKVIQKIVERIPNQNL